MLLTTPSAGNAVGCLPAISPVDPAAALLATAESLLPSLVTGEPIDAPTLRTVMEAAFGGSDAAGAWSWKDAYEAGEAAQLLFLRRFTPALQARDPAARLAMLTRVAALLPTQTRRSDESQALQQFSTPLPLGLVAATAAALTPADTVLEPSAGTGLLAIFAEMAGARLVLNELGATRASLLGRLFPAATVTRFDAAQIDDRLDPACRPSVVLMNPPFSVSAAVEGRVADAAWRHLTSALARLPVGGRLVAITGASLAPEAPAWRPAFRQLQQTARVVFSAAIDGCVYARHGTTVATRLTVIDHAPAADADVFRSRPARRRTPRRCSPGCSRACHPGCRSWPPMPNRQPSGPLARRSARRAPRRPPCRSRCVHLPQQRPSASRSPTQPATGRPQRPVARSARRSTSLMPCRSCASPGPGRIRRPWSSPPPWPRSHRPNPHTNRCCRRDSSRPACSPKRSSRR